MKGILLLRDLNEKNPDNVKIILTLARLGLQTGQFDKAIARIESALEIDSENSEAICYMANALEMAERLEEAQVWADRCAETASKEN